MTGATQPGQVFFFSGSNGRFSWAWSKVNYDSVDLYLDDFHKNDNRSRIGEEGDSEILVRDNPTVQEHTFKSNNGQIISGLFYSTIDKNDTDKYMLAA